MVVVSIQCLVYNHEPFLRQCLDGFITQKTDFQFEAIVHDDASTDGSAAIIREYAERYPDIIKPIYQTENQYSKGVSPTAIVTKSCRGKYIALCEGDDYWTRNRSITWMRIRNARCASETRLSIGRITVVRTNCFQILPTVTMTLMKPPMVG